MAMMDLSLLATSHLSPGFTQEQPTSQFTPVTRGAQLGSGSPSAAANSELSTTPLAGQTCGPVER